jgi:hypothetical protein
MIRVVSLELPEAEHRHCARHIYANCKKDFKAEKMRLLFRKCAKSYNSADMWDALKEMEDINPLAVEEFKNYDVNVYCRSYLKNLTKYDVIVSNMVETFNNYIIVPDQKIL